MDGNVYAVYDPGYSVDGEEEHLFEDLLANMNVDNNDNGEGDNAILAQIGLVNSDNKFVVQHMLARQTNWKALNDKNEHARLHSALLCFKGGL